MSEVSLDVDDLIGLCLRVDASRADFSHLPNPDVPALLRLTDAVPSDASGVPRTTRSVEPSKAFFKSSGLFSDGRFGIWFLDRMGRLVIIWGTGFEVVSFTSMSPLRNRRDAIPAVAWHGGDVVWPTEVGSLTLMPVTCPIFGP